MARVQQPHGKRLTRGESELVVGVIFILLMLVFRWDVGVLCHEHGDF
jgi:hypothetical protein